MYRIILIWLIFIFAKNAFASASPIGTVGAIIGKAESVNRTIILNITDDIFFEDVIKTSPQTNLQILFDDETVFTIGENTTITIDTYIYNPDGSSNENKLSATVLQGSFKVVTGLISKETPENLIINLPTGTLATRGTEFQAIVTPGEEDVIVLLGPGPNNAAGERPGLIEMSNSQGSVTVDKQFFFTSVKPNQSPSIPAPAPPQLISKINNSLNAGTITLSKRKKEEQNEIDEEEQEESTQEEETDESDENLNESAEDEDTSNESEEIIDEENSGQSQDEEITNLEQDTEESEDENLINSDESDQGNLNSADQQEISEDNAVVDSEEFQNNAISQESDSSSSEAGNSIQFNSQNNAEVAINTDSQNDTIATFSDNTNTNIFDTNILDETSFQDNDFSAIASADNVQIDSFENFDDTNFSFSASDSFIKDVISTEFNLDNGFEDFLVQEMANVVSLSKASDNFIETNIEIASVVEELFIEELDLEITPITGQNESTSNSDDVTDVSNDDESAIDNQETNNSSNSDQSSNSQASTQSENILSSLSADIAEISNSDSLSIVDTSTSETTTYVLSITTNEVEDNETTTSKTDPTISGLSNQTKSYGDSTFTVAATVTSGAGSISYSSSDEDVATVDSSTGEVTIKGIGSVDITASVAANDSYNANTSSYTITVSKGTPSVSSLSNKIYSTDDSGFTQAATVTSGAGSISYASSDDSVATVNSSTGAVSIVAAGTATITATAASNTLYDSASSNYSLTVDTLLNLVGSYGATAGSANSWSAILGKSSGTYTYTANNMSLSIGTGSGTGGNVNGETVIDFGNRTIKTTYTGTDINLLSADTPGPSRYRTRSFNYSVTRDYLNGDNTDYKDSNGDMRERQNFGISSSVFCCEGLSSTFLDGDNTTTDPGVATGRNQSVYSSGSGSHWWFVNTDFQSKSATVTNADTSESGMALVGDFDVKIMQYNKDAEGNFTKTIEATASADNVIPTSN